MFILNGIMTGQVVLVGFQHLENNQGEYFISCSSSAVVFINA